MKAQLIPLDICPPKYKIGDTVALKSGGMKMTVTYCDRANVTVSWSANRALHRATFPVEAVAKPKREKRFASVQG